MNSSTSTGLGFCDVLTIIFVVLKLIGVINWSWVWVFSPVWIPIAIIFGIFILASIIEQ